MLRVLSRMMKHEKVVDKRWPVNIINAKYAQAKRCHNR